MECTIRLECMILELVYTDPLNRISLWYKIAFQYHVKVVYVSIFVLEWDIGVHKF